MPKAFSIDIEDVVDLLGLERERKSRGASSFNVRCPFCGDTKYHLNINTAKGTYYCVRCTGDQKGTGALDLYGRVALGTPHSVGSGGNGKELKKKLCEALNIGPSHIHEYKKKAAPRIAEAVRADDAAVHSAYSMLLQITYFRLSEPHKDNLLRRGLSEQAIIKNQYRTIGNDFSWVANHPSYVDMYKADKLSELHRKSEKIKWFSPERVIAGLIVASAIEKQGIPLKGAPGFFKLGNHWCFVMEPGMIIPTRNAKGEIVALQVRKDDGEVRYKTVSSKGLPYGVVEGISRAHFPLGNSSIDENTTILLTEGPLKADVAAHLLKGKYALVALHGVNVTNELPSIFSKLTAAGISRAHNAFDMDKTTNPNVAKAGRTLKRIAAENGIALSAMCWDEEFAKIKASELTDLCEQNNISVPSGKSIFTSIGLMAQALNEKGVSHSVVASGGVDQNKNYWSDRTKGIDDYLLSILDESGKASLHLR